MCGFAAIYHQRKLAAPDVCIRSMAQRMQHRGPDADGFYEDSFVALGHRRLAIMDLSPDGLQPMWDSSGRYAVVYNGEIYNYQDLKNQLPAYPFRSKSDTEVLLAGFAAWGTDLFRRLNGIFAFALYDKHEGRMYLVRDRFGIKPLYYFEKDGVLAAASEQRAILATGLPEKKLNPDALSDFLWNGCVTGEKRLTAGIRQLQAGQWALMDARGFSVHTYFQLGQTQAPWNDKDPATLKKELLYLLRQAVSRQLMSDVPLGAFLSGGIDSSAIVALMSEVSSGKPLTFTVGFEENRFDESAYARMIADKFGTEHTVLTLRPQDFLDALPEALNAMDTVTMDGVNTYLVSKMTRNAGVTVALSGLGGDELFAGYQTFKRYLQWRDKSWWRLPHALRAGLSYPLRHWMITPYYRRIGAFLNVEKYDIGHVYPQFRGIFEANTIEKISGGKPMANPMAEHLKQVAGKIDGLPLLSQYSIGELSGYTQHMLLKDTDQMSMASSLEVRVPFFDNDLVDYVLQIPDAQKYPHTPKQLLVDALTPRLPDEIVHRPKMGFTLPWDQWLREELHDFCQTHIEALCSRGLLNADYIRQMWRWFQKGEKQVLWSHIWMFVVLEYWLQKNLD